LQNVSRFLVRHLTAIPREERQGGAGRSGRYGLASPDGREGAHSGTILTKAVLPRLPLARTVYGTQNSIENPSNVARNPPRLPAVTRFVRVPVAETVTFTRS
jgi:hypothetical protein